MHKIPKLKLKLVVIVSLVLCLWIFGIERSNAQISIPGRNSIQNVIDKLEQTVNTFDTKVGQYQAKIDEYDAKISSYDQKVNTTLGGLEGRVQSQLDGISGQVTSEIQGIKNSIDASIQDIKTQITKTMGTISWGLLVGDSFVSAIFSGVATWWVTRRLRRTVKIQLDELSQTFKQGVDSVVTKGEETAQAVTDTVGQNNVFAMIQGLQEENKQIIQILNDLKKS